jgi:hypothetical protein
VHVSHATPPVPHLTFVMPGRHRPISQQPLGHDAASHTHAPDVQRLPCGHGAFVPHWHRPFAEQSSARPGSQATHVPPAMPHAAVDDGMQVPFAQQPLGHERALHTHAPLTHTVPASQASLLPQRQTPVVALQPSASVGAQDVQLTPPMPQVANAGAAQTPLLQQPPGQDCVSHVHVPAMQLVPAPHAGLPPQRHPPVAAQLSARDISHVTQAAPPLPHALVEPVVVQVEPEQQPPRQLDGLQSLHTPPAHGPLPQF